MAEAYRLGVAQAGDYEAVCSLLDELDRLHWQSLPWLFRAPPSPPRDLAFFSKLLADPNSIVFVARADAVIGVAIALLKSAPEFNVFIPQRWGVIDNISVASSWQRKGVGAALAHAVEKWAQTQGAKWVELGVYDFNENARTFYERLGYLPLSRKLRKVSATE